MKGNSVMRLPVLTIVLAALAPGLANAADPCAGLLSADQIRGCLTAPGPSMATRGIHLGRGISVEGEKVKVSETSVNLTVNFEFDSARLTNDGTIALDALGTALSDPALRDDRFRIAGHTDAVGADDYNQKLSEARALAVRAYLARAYHLDAGKFDVVGYGKTQLYDTNDPTAAINRRVEVTKLSR
jgi:outer membrane protein OmpA-like peptidoglycan-associated protein